MKIPVDKLGNCAGIGVMPLFDFNYSVLYDDGGGVASTHEIGTGGETEVLSTSTVTYACGCVCNYLTFLLLLTDDESSTMTSATSTITSGRS